MVSSTNISTVGLPATSAYVLHHKNKTTKCNQHLFKLTASGEICRVAVVF